MTREQVLEVEVATLRRELRVRDLRIEALTLERDAAKEARDQMERVLDGWRAARSS